ncbi:hypothetical protein AVI53_02680 [Piscirickettsia salmonis]|nr:hypothetical protein PSLF89_06060 [Piscirickettsia salmonis LF-89 = ATCC VR-1361]ALY02863.1 hypothetical protein AWE47_08410 [Piscirickettsia salmonis]AMA42418.1 hypothetical protein AWJ11_08625 [Piscirickettsia salmonis]AOS34888.1 hypothetical protein AVM72_05765 [Piscirickettsia salmonis]APS59597.1 hypothetical protein AVI53_02680 [Piscirickettsia salmonis]
MFLLSNFLICIYRFEMVIVRWQLINTYQFAWVLRFFELLQDRKISCSLKVSSYAKELYFGSTNLELLHHSSFCRHQQLL